MHPRPLACVAHRPLLTPRGVVHAIMRQPHPCRRCPAVTILFVHASMHACSIAAGQATGLPIVAGVENQTWLGK